MNAQTISAMPATMPHNAPHQVENALFGSLILVRTATNPEIAAQH